ncbi:MAG: hypothetical protein MJ213_01165 [Bacilli bacterium]|nr:hypothetical protein [Bacilli bacterium]
METEHNRNYQRIERAITTAYKELLKENGTPDFSITKLCERAKINRTTFYKHYHGVYEITDKIEQELIYNLFNLKEYSDINMENFLLNPRPTLDVLNENIMKDLTYYKNTFRPERTHYIIDKVTNLLIKDFEKAFPKYAKQKDVMSKVKINIANLVGSFTNLYLQWLNGHIDCKLSDIADYLTVVIAKLYKDAKIPN